jgi:type-F conjugative transfer system secretin TraK
MNKLFRQSIHLGLIVGLLSGGAWAKTHVLTLSENQRLEANIGLEAMNRVSVSNDRIVNIFGDEGTFMTQTDEQSGQIFIKVTPENGDKPIALTLMTENGITQDLSLIPTDTEASTVILKSPKPLATQLVTENLLPGFSRSQNPTEPWIQALKQAVLGSLSASQDKGNLPQRKREGFKLQYQKSYETGPLTVQVWTLKNTTPLIQACFEQDFYQPGDKALSLEKTLLEPGEQIFFYSVGST